MTTETRTKRNNVQLGEISDFIRGVSYKSSELTDSSHGIPLINLKCVSKGGGFNAQGIKYFKGKFSLNSTVQNGDLVIANTDLTREGNITGAPLYIETLTDKAVISMDISKLIPKSNIDKSFLYFRLLTSEARSYMRSCSSGSTVLHLSIPQAKLYSFELPQLHKQKKIAQILTIIQKTIAEQEKFVNKVRTLKLSMRHHLLAYGVKAEKTKMTEIGEIPESWIVTKLGDVCEFTRGPFGGSLKKEIFKPDGIAVYEQSHAIKGDLNTFRYFIDEKKFDEMKRFEIREGDLIMSCSGTFGKVQIIPKDYKKGIINQALLRLRPHDSSPYFIKLLLESSLFQRQLRNNTMGVAIQNVASVSVLKNLLVALPDHASQQKIEVAFRAIENKMEQAERKLSAYQDLFKTLLHQLMSGEQSVKLTKSENKQNPKEVFKDAVVQSYLVKNIASPYVSHICLEKATYFTKRFAGVSPVSTYGTYTFGPYDPLNKYKGGLKLALNKKLIEPGESWGYKPGRNISEIESYLYYSEINSAEKVLSKLNGKSDSELEILATVDFSIFDLLSRKVKPTAELILNFINSTEAWREKVTRLKLDTAKVSKAMEELRKLAVEGLPYPKLS